MSAAAVVAAGLVDEGEALPTIAGCHTMFAFDVGLIDLEETLWKLTERTHKPDFHPIREPGVMVPYEHLADELDDLPTEIGTVEPNPDRGLLAREEAPGTTTSATRMGSYFTTPSRGNSFYKQFY